MSTFSYYPNLPNPPDYPGDNVDGMQTNSASIAGLIAQDHVAFNTSGGGKHVQSTYIQNNSKPSLSGTDMAVYSKLVSGLSQLFVEDQNGNEYQITGTLTTTGTIGPPPTFGGSYTLIGGLILKWGNLTVTTSGTVLTFPVAFPNACFGVQYSYNFTPANATTIVTGNYPSKTGITLRLNNGSSSANVFWMALGN